MVINPIVGVYIPIIRVPIKGGMTIPNIATFDHGTSLEVVLFAHTLPETNIFAPADGWLEDEISFWDGLFSGANC